ncbi:MAG: hypothetical protein DHS20C07_17150 [Methyloligella sp.]|nr:MAG: hypothetical protein DHS20C07_17150 [Methyloligella sp.]
MVRPIANSKGNAEVLKSDQVKGKTLVIKSDDTYAMADNINGNHIITVRNKTKRLRNIFKSILFSFHSYRVQPLHLTADNPYRIDSCTIGQKTVKLR